ncbi:MAG: L-fucose isomerase [Defluviitaleaceae bacterium]|nr:L-fucose isomerase [Defluviitaleaceae bacterium]
MKPTQIGALPAIGIRPTIDGRRNGIRESLEDQTMGMAKAAADLITSSLRYPGGQPVRVVIADTTIGGVAEAALCADKFSRENVCATLTVTPCWCYGTETMDTDPQTIKAVWGFNGTERPGAVYLAAVLSAHAQRGLPAFGIYGRDVRDNDDSTLPCDVKSKILGFARAAMAAGLMRGRSYLSIGSISMGIMGSYPDISFFQKYLGVRMELCDMTEVERRIALGVYDRGEYEAALAWTKANIKEGFDKNGKKTKSREEKDRDWEYCVKMTLICRDLMTGNEKLKEMGFAEEACGRNAIAAGFQGQRMWTDHKPNADFTEAMLCSSFDWNGAREAFVFATENDNLNALAMLFQHLLGQRASAFADVRTYWSPESIERVTGWKPDGKAAGGFIHLINSGAACLDAAGAMKDAEGNAAMKPFWEISDSDIKATLDAVEFSPADLDYFRGGGYSSRFETKAEMPVTMARVNLVDGLGPTLQIAEGHTLALPPAVSDALWKRTDYTWPCTWFAPRTTGSGAFGDVYSVMANWGANHGAFTYGHIGSDLITLASMLRIPVSMHNVCAKNIFRPHAWSAFGTNDPEGADYRACANYGPLYG